MQVLVYRYDQNEIFYDLQIVFESSLSFILLEIGSMFYSEKYFIMWHSHTLMLSSQTEQGIF